MNAENTTKVLLAGHQPLFLRGLLELLKEHFQVQSHTEIYCSEDLVPAIKKARYKWVFIDLGIFLSDHQNLLRRIVKNCTSCCKLVLFTDHYSLPLKKNLQKLSISGLFGKNISTKDLVFGLQCVAEGEQIFSVRTRLNGSCFEAVKSDEKKDAEKDSREGLSLLSKREREVLDLICRGFSTIAISEKLFISKFTVETHRKNILRKLDIRSSTELVSYAYREGWVY